MRVFGNFTPTSNKRTRNGSMTDKIMQRDFHFTELESNSFRVVYTLPHSQRKYTAIVDNLDLVQKVKNELQPKRNDLIALKKLIKQNHDNLI